MRLHRLAMRLHFRSHFTAVTTHMPKKPVTITNTEDQMRKLLKPSRRAAIAAAATLATAAATMAFVNSAGAAPDHAGLETKTCSLATLHGTYLFHGDGTAINDKGHVPLAYAGSFHFDGVGHLQGHITTNLDGLAISHIPFTGSYTMAADCSGTYEITNAIYNDLYAAPSGDEFTYVQTGEGPGGDHDLDVAATSARRVSRN